MRKLLVVVLAMAFLVPSSGAARTHASSPMGVVIFREGPSVGLYATDTRSGILKRVLTTYVEGARWSPDGRRIAFTQESSDSTGAELWVMGEDGHGLARLATRAADGLSQVSSSSFSWSPDGKQIAFVVDTASRTGISAVDVRTRRIVPLTSAPASSEDSDPAWSPDGKRIVFERIAPGTNIRDLWIMRANGQGQRRLTTSESVFSLPEWSPDGKSIVFYPCCLKGIDVIGADGFRWRTLVDHGVFEPAWSPDGRWIALSGDPTTDNTAPGTYLVRPDGSRLHKISKRGISSSIPSWSPNSRWLVVVDHSRDSDVWAISANGTGERRLTDGTHYGYVSYDPLWQPKTRPLTSVAGAVVPRTIPTSTLVAGHTLRARFPIRLLAADGARVAIAYTVHFEVWNTQTNALQVLGAADGGAIELALAGRRLAWHGGALSGGGVDSWSLGTATLDAGGAVNVKGLLCCSYPMTGLFGDGSLLVLGTWGPCRITMHPACETAPKQGGTVWRIQGDQATKIASAPGALTPLAVDAGRIFVDHEDGRLEILRDDGTSLRTLVLPKEDVLGAKLQGRDLVVLGPDALFDYDADTGALLHEWSLTGPSPRLDDVWGGFASYVSGSSVVVVRLADGARRTIATDGVDVHTQLEDYGLVYSYNANAEAYPGRVVFVPFSELRVA